MSYSNYSLFSSTITLSFIILYLLDGRGVVVDYFDAVYVAKQGPYAVFDSVHLIFSKSTLPIIDVEHGTQVIFDLDVVLAEYLLLDGASSIDV